MSEKLATSLHLLLCKREHDEGCPWYLEEQTAGYWNAEAHSAWLEKATRIVEVSGGEEEEIQGLINRLYKLCGDVIYLKERFSSLAEMIDTIITEGTKLKLPKTS